MSRLPKPGFDADSWGTVLNDFLSVELNSDGTLKKAADIAAAKTAADTAQATANAAAVNTAVVHNTGDETIAGVKTFSSSPIVPANSFAESTVTNLTTDLASKLTAANNLGDVPTPATARTNLGLGSSAVMTPAQIAADSAFTSAYAPVVAARPTNLTVFLGDSITIASDTFNGTSNGDSFPTYVSLLSGQRIRKIRNVGVGGNTSAQMLARFDTDVTPLAPGTVHVLAGTNDTGTVSLTTYQSNMRAIVAKIRAIGAVPIIATLPPNSTGIPGNRRQLIIQFNAWLRTYCAVQKIFLVDFYALLTDPTTGNWKSIYPSGDGTHPGAAGTLAMAQLVVTTIAPLMPPNAVPLCMDDVDENNLLLKGCFGGYSGSSLPTGYTDNAGTTGVVLSYTTDSLVAGQMLTLTSTGGVLRELTIGWSMGADTVVGGGALAGAATVTVASINPTRGVLFLGSGATAEVCRVASVSGSGPYVATLVHPTIYAHPLNEACVVNALPGDVIASSGVYTSNGGVAFTVKIAFTPSASFFPLTNITSAVTRGVWYAEGTIPASTTTLFFRPNVAAGTGVVSFGQVGLYNLTRMGSLL